MLLKADLQSDVKPDNWNTDTNYSAALESSICTSCILIEVMEIMTKKEVSCVLWGDNVSPALEGLDASASNLLTQNLVLSIEGKMVAFLNNIVL